MKKIIVILAVILFSFTCVGGSVFYLADIPSAVQEDQNRDNLDEDGETNATVSGYWTSYYSSSFASGTGTSTDPYLIETAQQLARLAYLMNGSSYASYDTKYYNLVADINLSAHYWVPIGTTHPFKGNFYGKYYNISGMTCYMSSATDSNYLISSDNANSYGCALFGNLAVDDDSDAWVWGFSMSGISITTASVAYDSSKYYKFAGVVACASYSATYVNSINLFGNITSSFTGTPKEVLIGGVVAYACCYINDIQNYLTIKDSYSSNSSSSNVACCGGIAGWLAGGQVNRAAMLGYIDFYGLGTNSSAGGIAGRLSNGGTVKLSYVVRGESPSSSYYWLSRCAGGGLIGLVDNGKIISSWSYLGIKLNSGLSTTYKGYLVGKASSLTMYCCISGGTQSCSASSVVGSGSYSGGGVYTYTALSTYRRSSSFASYMKNSSYSESESWAYYWEYNYSYLGHLNYGFPVSDTMCATVSLYANEYVDTYGVKTISTGVDTSYTSGDNDGTATSSLYFLMGGTLSISTTGMSGSYFRYMSKNNRAAIVETVASGTGSETSKSATITSCSGYYSGSYGSTSKYLIIYIVYSPPAETYWQNNYASEFAGGTGTSSDPYLISNGAQLARLAYLSNSASDYSTYQSLYYKLTDDIDISGKLWTPIGKAYAFAGNFDGNGYTIKGLTCQIFGDYDPIYYNSNSYIFNVGLFGYVCGGQLSNFVLVDVDIGSDDNYQSKTFFSRSIYVGAVVGRASYTSSVTSKISQVGVFGSVSSHSNNYIGNVGGICGDITNNVTIEKSFNYASVYSETSYGVTSGYVGGIVGSSYSNGSYTPIIDNCYNAGGVSGYGLGTGGLLGYANGAVSCRRSYNIGNVQGYFYKGGLLGYATTSTTVYNCFSDAKISSLYASNKYGKYNVYNYYGALGGYCSATLSYCGYNSSKCSSQTYSGSSSNITNTTTFTTSTIPQAYSFTPFSSGSYTWSRSSGLSTSSSSTWRLPNSISYKYLNNGYPVLSWSLRLRDVTTNFNACGTSTLALTGDGATSGEAQSTIKYGILGMGIKIYTTPTAGSYGDYTGMYETKSDGSTKVKVSEEPRYYEFTPDGTFDTVDIRLNGNVAQSGIKFSTSGFSTNTKYRVYYVDNNEYGTSGASCYIKNICFKTTTGNGALTLPEITSSYAGSFVNKTSTSTDWQANAVSSNTYTGVVVLLWKDGTVVKTLSSPTIAYSTINTSETKAFQFTYNSSSHNRIRIGLNGNTADATFMISMDSLSSGYTYRITFGDITTYDGTAGNSGSLRNIRLQQKSGSTWIDLPMPDAFNVSNSTATRVNDYTYVLRATAVSGNTYNYSKVQLWQDDTYLSEITSTTISATTQYFWTTFIKGGGYYGSAYSYYAIYTARPVTVNLRVAAYTPYDNAVNYPMLSSTVGYIKYTKYTTGHPLKSTQFQGSSIYNSPITSYVYRSLTLTSVASISAWYFRGWYTSTSSTISASACSGTAMSTSSSYTVSPSSDTTLYYFAVFSPVQSSVSFGGTYTSENDGTTYSRKTSSSGYPYCYFKYIKPTYSAIVNSTTTTQYSYNISSATTITYAVYKYSFGIANNSNYTFEGWYYGDTPTLITTSTSHSVCGYSNIHARFKRKVVNYDIYTMTDTGTGTYTNNSAGGSPYLYYYNRSNTYTSTKSSSALTTIEVQAGTTISIQYSNDYYANSGYKFMGISTSSSTATTPTTPMSYDSSSLNQRSLTASSSAQKLCFFYKKTSANLLKHATKNLAKISNVSVSYVNGFSFSQNANGFYESQNFGVNNSYSLAKVSFTLAETADVTFDYISYGEKNCDYGIFSKIDTTLASSYNVDSNVKLLTSGDLNCGCLGQVVYKDVSAGTHYVYIKYRKDGSAHYGYDSLQFRLVTEYSRSSYWYFEDGEYPQSYVGDSMNNTLINNATHVGYLDYNNGKVNITKDSGTSANIIKVYSYSGKKYAAIETPNAQTLTMNDGNSYTFTAGGLYYFAFEPIRWRVEGDEPLDRDATEMTGSNYYTLPQSLKYTDAITVNIWAYMDDWSEYATQDMVMLSCSEGGGFSIETSSSGNVRYSVFDQSIGYVYADMYGASWKNMTSGWHMFTFTFNGSSVVGYVDGSQQGPSVTLSSGKIGYCAGNTIFVGAEASDNTTTPEEPRGFVGQIDRNITIENYAMSYTEITNLYQNSNGFMHFWDFGERRTGFDAVSQNVLGFGAVTSSLSSVLEGWKFTESDMYTNVSKSNSNDGSTSSTELVNSTFSYIQTSALEHNYQYFAPTSSGQDKVGSNPILEENIRVASIEELENNLSDLRANASDMVACFLGISTDKYCEYWTRDLGLYLRNGYTITSTGEKKSVWLNRVSGIRFSITFAEGSCPY